MSRKTILPSCLLVILAGATSARGVTFTVDASDPTCSDATGTPYCTIQAAVNAAAALDVPGPPGDHNNPPADPVEIIIHAGVYTENVNIPADATNSFNGQNDHWTIRANAGDRVLVRGGINIGNDRDHCVFDGINVEMIGRSGYFFGVTARNNTVRNAVIYGGGSMFGNQAVNFAGIAMDQLFGTNTIEHVTIVGNTFGISSSNNSTFILRDSIVAFSDNYGMGQFGGNPNPISFSDVFNAENCNSLGNLGDCSSFTDGGDNINYPVGNDPMFASLNPVDANFLFLRPNSPAAGTASTAGAYTNGQFNMGALPVDPGAAPAVVGACCHGDADCLDTTTLGCATLSGTYEGDGTACATTNCAPPLGACCLPNGGCAELTSTDCADQEGTFKGVGTTCSVEGAACANTGACCQPDETCTEVTEAQCINVDDGFYNGDDTTCAAINCLRTLTVGPGQQFATIQAAVNAAAAQDVPSAPDHNTPPDKPITIIVFEGIYDEVVSIPADPTGLIFNGPNDSWTIRAARTADTGKAVDDVVILRGYFTIGNDRDHLTFDGIHILALGDGRQDYGFQFTQTARNCTVKNCFIYNVRDNLATGGDLHGNALYANRLFGGNFAEHVTIVNGNNGIFARDGNSSWISRNTIVAHMDAAENESRDGLRSYSAANLIWLDHSLVYNPPNLPPADPVFFEDTVNCYSNFQYGDCANVRDQGGNVNWPLSPATCDLGGTNTCVGGPIDGQACSSDLDCVGQGPDFLSLDPMDADFLRLSITSPARGAGNSVGAYTDGEMNMGVFGSGPAPVVIEGACCQQDGSCLELTIIGCAASGGVWQGAGSSCAGINCDFGACCALNGVCTETTVAECADGPGPAGTFQGPGSTCAIAACPFIRPIPFADRDNDGDVDHDDFAEFQICYTGPGGGVPPGCEDFDRPEPGFPDGDGDVDEDDFAAFLNCVSGPAIPADPACEEL